jgi:hypothetical protein
MIPDMTHGQETNDKQMDLFILEGVDTFSFNIKNVYSGKSFLTESDNRTRGGDRHIESGIANIYSNYHDKKAFMDTDDLQ